MQYFTETDGSQWAKREDVEPVVAALSVFADCCDANISPEEHDDDWAKMRLRVRHYRAARDALL